MSSDDCGPDRTLKRSVEVNLDSVARTAFELTASDCGWTLRAAPNIFENSASFSWTVLDEALSWLAAPKVEFQEFRAFNDHHPENGANALVMGKGLSYLGYYSQGAFFGGVVGDRFIDEVVAALAEMRALLGAGSEGRLA